MNWGARIVVSFIVFAAIIISMVVISMNQDINLVAEDYYKQEIEYEDQIQRIRNTQALQDSPEINLVRANPSVVIQFPKNLSENIKEGYVHLFRPSDSNLDKKYYLKLDETGSQQISLAGYSKGLWKVKLYWEDQDLEYYLEKILTL